MRAKRVYEFLKTGDVKSSLGIGRVAEIRELFRSVGIPDGDYQITNAGVVFDGDLDLRGTNIAELPDGLSIGGDLYLMGTPIASLPDGLSIGGYLYLRGTPITALPDGLSVGGCLELSGTAIVSLPDGLSVRWNIYVDPSQKDLIAFIRSSRFANKLEIWG